MLYFLFLYQMESGELLYEKEFQPNIDSQMDLFGSFFSALKIFISKVAEDTREELKTIGLGKLIASVIRIIEVNIDMVIIAEKGDKKEIQKLSSDFKELVLKYKDLFSVDFIKTEKFESFDKEINTIALTHRKVLDTKALEEKQKDFLKSVWEQRGKFSEKIRLQRKELENDRINLVNKIQNEKNVISKLSLCKQVLELSDKLEDEQVFIVYQNMAKKLVNEIKDQKLRLNFYLRRIQDALKISLNKLGEGDLLTGDYKEIYTNLYSFSSKLKGFAPEGVYKKYYDLSNKLVYIKGVSSQEFSKVINEISIMDENIESYLR
ncbi:MAG: hypothetical protein EAX91_08580 [Candidatus Lokiarchaeota archaeon]|nr:hypothetical protein [Candidatus Lokiarchaeota archaeon]